jgi:putative ABC transport system ATP-binding protein
MIYTEKLSKLYFTDDIETLALNEVALHIQQGEFVSVMGPSGCGKTTLLNILGLLDHGSSGSYTLLGSDTGRMSERQRAAFRKAHIGFVFQSFNLIEELNVLENVELPLQYLGVRSKERRQRATDILEKMNMLHRRFHFPQQLSGGQQQRVAVARAVVTRPQILLADEPTGNLDSAHGDEVMRLLSDLNEEGATIVMVTHSARNADYGHRIIRLLDGKVVAENKLRSYHD